MTGQYARVTEVTSDIVKFSFESGSDEDQVPLEMVRESDRPKLQVGTRIFIEPGHHGDGEVRIA